MGTDLEIPTVTIRGIVGTDLEIPTVTITYEENGDMIQTEMRSESSVVISLNKFIENK